MEMKDPAPGQPWALNQFWVCNRCGRHFWTTYTTAPGAKPAPAPATPGATTVAPTAQAPAAAAVSGKAATTAAEPVTNAEPKPETTA